MKPYLLILLILTVYNVFSQNVINFESSSYVSTYFTHGDSTKFIISQNNKLQLNDNQSGQSQLLRSHGLNSLQFKEWKLSISLNFSPSSNNYARYYLVTTDTVLLESSDGLFLQFGESGSNDAVRLIHQTNGQTTEILTGIAAQINSSFSYEFEVSVDSLNNWDISYFNSASAEWELMDSANYPNVNLAPNMGLFCKYTSSNSDDFIFDDLVFGNIPIDTLGPTYVGSNILSAKKLSVLFNENLNPDSLSSIQLKYNGFTILIDSLYLDSNNPNQLYIELEEGLRNLTNINISFENLYDLLGNSSSIQFNSDVVFSEIPEFSDIVFTELMIDPSPSIGLPEVEYVEIYNRSDKVFNLSNFVLTDKLDTNALPSTWIYPGEYLLLCDDTDTGSFTNAEGLMNFINLNNTEDDLSILNRNGLLVDRISYDSDFLNEHLHARDGRSLSLRNINYRCKDSGSWSGSTEDTGGSPGIENMGANYLLDTIKPKLEYYSFPSSHQVKLIFDEQMDSTYLNADDVQLSFNDLSFFDYSSNSLLLEFEHEIAESEKIELLINEIRDCNLTKTSIYTHIIKPSEFNFGDIVISEILFNPITGGSDYLELYNRSDKYFNLTGLQISKEEDTVKVDKDYLFPPKALCYFSEDVTWLKQHYPFTGDTNFLEINLPNFPNDSSRIVISVKGKIIDELRYNEDLHFKVLEDFEGKSLERINLQSSERAVLKTAASRVEFGTPGMENSQIGKPQGEALCNVTPKIITPNNDGFKDFTTIYYSHLGKQSLLSVRVYNENGVAVKTLLNNYLSSKNQSVYWDGTDENNEILNVGNYIVLSEIVDVEKNELQVIKVLVILSGK